uniref:Lipoyl-binding domain-containing protein n=1 Tax=Panagrolaimus sp. ES5 TaxID=591445 RepID=A0AC34GUA6_9BILA
MVQNNLTKENVVDRADGLTFPKSFVEFLQVLRGKPKIDRRVVEDLAALDLEKLKQTLEEKHGRKLRDVDVMSSAMFPKDFDDVERFRQQPGPVEIEKAKTLTIQLLARGKLDNKCEREVFFELNGQMFSIFVRDEEASKDIVIRPKTLAGVRGHIGAPMPDEILDVLVKEGDKVNQKDALFVLSAMEMTIEAPVAGTVKRIYLGNGEKLAAGDLIVEIEAFNS